MSAVYIHMHIQIDFFMEANNMNPDQTAPRVHIVCNKGNLSIWANERAEEKSVIGGEKG